MSDAWEKRPSESGRAYAAFLAYRDMGAQRSLSKTADIRPKLGPLSTLKVWSAKYAWGSRAEKWDSHLREEADRARVAKVKEAVERHTTIARGFTARVAARLNEMDPGAIDLRDLPKWLEVAVKIERLGLGLPTQNTEVAGKDGGPVQIDLSSARERLAEKLAGITTQTTHEAGEDDPGDANDLMDDPEPAS